MTIQKYHIGFARVAIWISIILYFIGFLILFSSLGQGSHYEDSDRSNPLVAYLLTFGIGTLTFLIALWRLRQAEAIVAKPSLSVSDKGFFSARRMMMVSTLNYTFYALDGTEIANTREEISPLHRSLRLALFLFYPSPILPFVVYIHAGERHIKLAKRSGFQNKFYIYDENNHLLSIFQSDSVFKNNYTIFDAEGHRIALLKTSGLIERYSVISEESISYMMIQLGGIPREAMELFGNIEGDIIDIDRENTDEEMFLKIIAAPIIVRLTTRR